MGCETATTNWLASKPVDSAIVLATLSAFTTFESAAASLCPPGWVTCGAPQEVQAVNLGLGHAGLWR